MGLYPQSKRGWFWATVVGDDRPLVIVVDDELPLPKEPNLEVRSSGIWTDFIPQVELEHFTVGLEAFGVGIDDPDEVFNGLRGDRTPVGFDLEWETEGDGWGLLPSGFELPCRAHGEILVGHEEFDFDGLGVRRRWWGDDARRSEPGIWLSGWWDDGAPLGGRCEMLHRRSAEVIEMTHPHDVAQTVVASIRSVAPLPIIRPTQESPGQRWRMLCRVEAIEADERRQGVGWLDLQ